ncbi:tRNA uridine-5-carboxymethylaminomethyl(34) synthesis GTPase MnmE [Xanthomonadaceae bacterium JHOS43]|nr:tRNA uridine-5-carboxymethylaminomethyl(34) synthesis GTPase MnmE [Xanthomonadaceae bacterium JHOS43]
MAAHRTDTIAAIATPPGAGGIGVIRVSGPRAPDIARAFLGRAPRPRHAHYAVFRDPDGEVIDTGLLLHFPAPASFTGEHVLELQVHGSRPVLHALLQHLRAMGARAARPGEFSERAFLNGKLDLAQAEAIADLIGAGSQAAARAAQRSLQGVFSRQVHAVVEDVVALRMQVEVAIDFSDEDIPSLAPARLRDGIAALMQRLDALLAGARRGQRLTDGLHVVILGRPNAGKSSLLNALAADERAIVTEQAGTTRDLLRETIVIDGVELTLVDTAGLRDSTDPIEREGIRRARNEAASADLVVQVLADGDGPDPALSSPATSTLVVHNKIDLTGQPATRRIIDGIEHVHLSARSGEGLDLLRESLRHHAGADSEGAFSARARHVDALRRAARHLGDADAALAAGGAWEIAAEELRQVQAVLGEITGEFGVEDLLGRIFANFCIGK